MSTVDIMDPTTFEVPSGQALLYAEVSGNETIYKYKLTSGSTGTVNTSILAALAVKSADLPVLVYQADLLGCLNESFATVADLTIATSTKASVDFVKKVAAQKVNKADFLTRLTKMPTTAEMEDALSHKVDSSVYASDMAGKANAADVYTIAETQNLINGFVTAKTVADIDELNALDAGIYAFVWVVDPSGDQNVADTTNAALYRWDPEAAKYVFVATAGTGYVPGDGSASGDVIVTVNTDETLIGTGTANSQLGIAPGVLNRITALETYKSSSSEIITTQGTVVDSLAGTVAVVQNTLDAHGDTISVLEEKAHTHSSENNYTFLDRAMACNDSTTNGVNFTEIILPEDTVTMENIDAVGASYYVFTIAGKPYYLTATSSKFTNQPVDLSVGATVTVTNAIDVHITGSMMAVIIGAGEGATQGTLWVRGLSKATSNKGGSLLPEYAITDALVADWAQVGSDNNWSMVTGFINHWLAFKKTANGNKLYTAGYNVCGLQANAALDSNGNPIIDDESGFGASILKGKCHLVNELAEVKLSDDNGQTWYEVDDWLDAQGGCYHTLALRGASKETGGTMYAWGCDHDGCLGNGVTYTHDMKIAYAWSNGSSTVYTLDKAPTTATNVYADFATVSLLGTPTAATSDTITINEVVYTRDTVNDKYPYKVGNHVPQVVRLEDGTVYNDWKIISAGYYHNGAIRYNSKGESEVYLWGSAEYGQLGTGEYVDEAVQGGEFGEGVNTKVKLYGYPHLLTKAEFPYTDVIDICCTHYGTFLKRSNGELWFVGCNKRNHFGTGKISDGTAIIPKFTRLGSRFTGKDLYVETYGSLLINKSQRMAENADIAVKAVLADNFAPEYLQEALQDAHAHAIDTNVIDAAAILINQYANVIPNACANYHNHANKASLDTITVRNGNLFINNVLFTSTSSNSGGAVAIVDPSNVTLDDLADVEGMSNIAGGMPLEVISYYEKSDNEAYLQVAPLGGNAPKFSRYVDIEVRTGEDTYNTVISKEVQAKGVYAIPSNATGSAMLIRSSADMKTVIDKLLSGSSGNITFYYLDSLNPSNWKSGSVVLTEGGTGNLTIDRASLAAGDLYFHDDDSGDHLPLSEYSSPGLGSRQPEESAFFDVYDLAGNLLISKTEWEANTYYFEDGTVVTSVGSAVSPTGTAVVDEEMRTTYHSIYNGSDIATATCVIPEATIAVGLFRKDGSQLRQVKAYDVPEAWDDTLFENVSGGIYVHPGRSSFVGVANQYYEYNNLALIKGTTADATTGEYPLESVVLKLTKKLTNYEDTTSTTGFVAGQVGDPMVAAIASPHRAYTSHVTGEYNAAIGYNAEVSGNLNNVFGDFSVASGIANIVTGPFTFCHGTNNRVAGNNSFCVGSDNIVACDLNYVWGSSNKAHGYYGHLIGSNNRTYGVDQIAVGIHNEMYGQYTVSVGRRNVTEKTATNAILVGNRLDVHAKDAMVIGHNGVVYEFEGNFPGTDTDVLKNLNASSFGPGGYDTVGICNRNGIFFTMGDPDGAKAVTEFDALSYTKYLWRPNNAYFSVAANSRGSLDPFIFEPFHRWNFKGILTVEFTEAIQDKNDATKFTVDIRNGGRVKTFDPGKVLEDKDSAGYVYLDFNYATRWKLTAGQSGLMVPRNFVDGAEAYIVLYAGSTPDWDIFVDPSSISTEEGVNVFDQLIWVGNAPSPESASTGFALVKLMIVDNTCIAEAVASTLA